MSRADTSGESDTDEPPLVGRKEPFCAAVASKLEVSMRAAPTDLLAGDPLLLTVRIKALGAWKQPPRRPDLRGKREYTSFARRFSIENAGERLLPAERTWEFDYVLRPLSEQVREIPSLLIVYYKPGLTPREKGFQATDAPALPLHVRPRAGLGSAGPQRPSEPIQYADELYRSVQGPAVLRRDDPYASPGWLVSGMSLLAPPALCAAWYIAWRRRYPDAAGQARRRRSAAARQALRALRALCKSPPADLAGQVGEVLATYLRQRLDLPATEPTPVEVEAHLQVHGVSADLAGRVASFFGACDAARFAPVPPRRSTDLSSEAETLVLALEVEPCLSPTS